MAPHADVAETGRRRGLKNPGWKHHAGSIPAIGTICQGVIVGSQPASKAGAVKAVEGSSPSLGATQKQVLFRQYAPVAQMAEQRTLNPKVEGSTPSGRTRFKSVAQFGRAAVSKTEGCEVQILPGLPNENRHTM